MSERDRFLGILAERFYPLLRSEFFRGSGTTLRRVRAPVLHVVNTQGSRSGEGFYVNLGAHLDFLPIEGAGVCVPERLKQYECAFRDRLDPPGLNPRRWAYGRDVADAEAIVARLTEGWLGQGHAFFNRYSRFPESFAELIRQAVESPPHTREGLTFARIAVRIGLRREAEALASQALETASPQATLLRRALERFLAELGA